MLQQAAYGSKIYWLTFFPFINHVMCGAGLALDVEQFAISRSPIRICFLAKSIFGGPFWGTVEIENKYKRVN